MSKEMGTYLRQTKKFAHPNTGGLAPFCSCKVLSFPQQPPTEITGQPVPLLAFCVPLLTSCVLSDLMEEVIP